MESFFWIFYHGFFNMETLLITKVPRFDNSFFNNIDFNKYILAYSKGWIYAVSCLNVKLVTRIILI